MTRLKYNEGDRVLVRVGALRGKRFSFRWMTGAIIRPRAFSYQAIGEYLIALDEGWTGKFHENDLR